MADPDQGNPLLADASGPGAKEASAMFGALGTGYAGSQPLATNQPQEFAGPPLPGEMLASNAPATQAQPAAANMPPQEPQPPPTQGGSSQSVRVLAPGEVATVPAPQGFNPSGGGFASEARARGRHDAEENDQLRRDYQSAVNEQKQATDAVSEVQRYQASDLFENMQHQQRQLAEIDARGKQSQLVHDRTIQERDQQLNDAVNAQKNMVFDPDKYVNSMSVGQKIMTAIAVGLGAIGSSRSIGGSGENIGMKMLQDSIQHGIDQQKEAYRRAGVGIDLANNAYARARQSGLDDKDATIAARLASINDHKMAAEVITARYEPDRVDANRKVLQANLDSQTVKAQQEFAQSSQAAAARNAADVLGATQANFNMALGAANYNLAAQSEADRHQDRLAEMAMKQQVAEQKAAGKGPGSIMGWSGVAPTQEQQNKAAEAVANYETLVPLMQKMSDFRKEHPGGETLARGPVAESKSMHKTVLTEVKNLAGLGVLTGSDVEIVTEMIGPPPDSHGISDEAYQATIQQALKYVEKKTQAKMRAYGYTPTRDANPLTRKADPMTADTGFREAEGGR